MKLGNGEWLIGDCLDLMKTIPDDSVDMVLCDLPYGTTQNKWDSVIPFEPLWEQYWRICKSNAAVVLTAQPPFDKLLGASQIKYLKYEWIWEKPMSTGFLNAKKQPLKAHENVLVFYREQCVYNPQFTPGKPYKALNGGQRVGNTNYGKFNNVVTENTGFRYPRSIVEFSHDKGNETFHATQKPVDLFAYLIKTYTNENDLVLDNTAGSGTTAFAAEKTNRRWICIEKDEQFSMKAIERIKKPVAEKARSLENYFV